MSNCRVKLGSFAPKRRCPNQQMAFFTNIARSIIKLFYRSLEIGTYGTRTAKRQSLLGNSACSAGCQQPTSGAVADGTYLTETLQSPAEEAPQPREMVAGKKSQKDSKEGAKKVESRKRRSKAPIRAKGRKSVCLTEAA